MDQVRERGQYPNFPGYQCDFCPTILSTPWAKTEHELIHINIRLQCDDCDKTFSNRGNLSRHRSKNHKKKKKKENQHDKIYVEKQINTLYSFDGKRLHCGECMRMYTLSEEEAYWAHIEEHNK